MSITSATRKKVCISCIVGPRSSELRTHYIYALATGLVVSCRNYLLGKGTFVNLRKYVNFFLNVILII